MSWYEQPAVARTDADGVAVWRLTGDWTRDLPLEVRRDATALLKDVPRRLVLVLRDVKFIDSWGEETLCDAMQRILDDGGFVVWTFDAVRRAEFQGIVVALERRKVVVKALADDAAAIAEARNLS